MGSSSRVLRRAEGKKDARLTHKGPRGSHDRIKFPNSILFKLDSSQNNEENDPYKRMPLLHQDDGIPIVDFFDAGHTFFEVTRDSRLMCYLDVFGMRLQFDLPVKDVCLEDGRRVTPSLIKAISELAIAQQMLPTPKSLRDKDD